MDVATIAQDSALAQSLGAVLGPPGSADGLATPMLSFGQAAVATLSPAAQQAYAQALATVTGQYQAYGITGAVASSAVSPLGQLLDTVA